MVSMELDDESKIDAIMPTPMPNKPDYPYGLKICLTQEEFKKLGIDAADAVVGAVFHFNAMARITSVSCNDSEGMGESCRVEAQIEEMGVVDQGDSEEPKKKRRTLYE